ncbi:MAG: HAMP domain-containing protein, partial [Vampirovibrionia bacterium]
MARKKLHVNINTRLLLYFLFVTILPLAILALSITFLIHYSLNEKSNQEISDKMNSLISIYNNRFKNYKTIIDSDQTLSLVEYIEKNNINSLKKQLTTIEEKNDLSFAVLYNAKLEKIASVSTKDPLYLYPIKKNILSIQNMLTNKTKDDFMLSTEIIDLKSLKDMGIQNKIYLQQETPVQKDFGMLAQIAITTINKYTPSNEINNNNIDVNNTENIENNSNKTIVGYLLIGNKINTDADLSKLIIDMPNIAVNIAQDNIVIASNEKIPFDLTKLNTKQNQQVFINQEYTGEQFIDGQWYKLDAKPLTNHANETVAKIVVGLPDTIFRSLKEQNSNLILQISIIIAGGGLILAFLFTKNITDPISNMVEAVDHIKSGDLSHQLKIPAEDELGKLAISINEMAGALEERKNKIEEYNKILFDQKTKLEAMFNYSADGIMMLDKNRRITSANPVICKWLETNIDSILGKYFYEVITYKQDPGKYRDNIEKVESIKDLYEITKQYPDASINEIDLEISYSTIKIDSEGIINYVLILRDITKRKETEELRENFIATLTHDLRTPLLAGVHTLEYFLSGSFGELTEKQKYITKQLIESNEGLLRMVNTLLDTYSYESGKHSLVKREINLNKVIDSCINELQSLAKDKNQTILFSSTDNQFMIIGDRQEIKRVVTNILSNAIIHTDENGIIEFNITKENQFAKVSIKDNGVGLSEKDQEKIFNRFARGGRTLR